MSAPSTAWRESVAPDEAARFAGYAEQFVEMQKRKAVYFANEKTRGAL